MEHQAPGAGPNVALSVKTELEDFEHLSELELARQALEQLIDEAGEGQRAAQGDSSQAAVTVSWRNHERERQRLAALAHTETLPINVDGADAAFQLAAHANCWAAVRRAEGLTITVTARGIEPHNITIEPLNDPVGALFNKTG